MDEEETCKSVDAANLKCELDLCFIEINVVGIKFGF